MARYGRSYRRPYRRTYNQVWCPLEVNTTISNPRQGQSFLIGNFPLGFMGELEGTMERMRGGLRITVAGTRNYYAVGFTTVLPKVILGSKTAGDEITNLIPTPVNTDGSDDFPWIGNLCVPTGAGSFDLDLDSKAKRKIDKDKLITLACYFLKAATGGPDIAVSFAGLVRTLCRLRK